METSTHQPTVAPQKSLIPLDLDLGNIDLYRERRKVARVAFGPSIVKAFRNSMVDDKLGEELDTALYEWIGDTLHLPEGTDVKSFSRRQLGRADKYITNLADLIEGPYSNVLHLLEEVIPTSEHPYQMLYDINSRRTTPQLRFELLRKNICAMIAGLSSARKLKEGIDTNVDILIRALNLHLWLGDSGEVHDYTMFSYHDNHTNEVVGQPMLNRMGGYRPGMHIKHHRVSLRMIQKIPGEKSLPLVDLRHRIKSDNSAITSIIGDYFRKGIIPEERVAEMTDYAGLRFLVFGDEAATEEVAQRTLAALEKQFGKIDSKSDNKVQDKGGPKKPKFLRYIITSPRMYELQFWQATDYLNQTYEVGEYSKARRVYTGRAHELYRLNRLMQNPGMINGVGRWNFPQPRYFPDYDMDIEDVIRAREHEVVKRLRATNAVQLG